MCVIELRCDVYNEIECDVYNGIECYVYNGINECDVYN